MEQDLVDAALAFAGITELVGEDIDWNRSAQGATGSRLVLRKTGGGPGHTMDGPDGLAGYRITFECWGDTFADATDLKAQVHAFCATLRTAPFQGAFPLGEIDSFAAGDGPQGSGPTDQHRTSLDVRVWHSA